MNSERDYCERCELFNGDIVDGVCAYCRAADEVTAERGELFAFDGDGRPAFVGHDTGETWNGWAVPAFEFDEAVAVLRYLETLGFVSMFHVTNSDALTLTFREIDSDDLVEVLPNDNGRYVFDGWCWDRVALLSRWPLDAVEERLALNIPNNNAWRVLDAFRDELLDGYATEVSTDGVEETARTFPKLTEYLTQY